MLLEFKLIEDNNTLVYDINELKFDINNELIDKNVCIKNVGNKSINYELFLYNRTKYRPLFEKINTLTIILPKCSSKCFYCVNRDITPFDDSNIDYDKVLNTIEQIAKTYDIDNLIISGGEPLETQDIIIKILDLFKNLKEIELFTTLPKEYPIKKELIDKMKSLTTDIRIYVTFGGLKSKYHISLPHVDFQYKIKTLNMLYHSFGFKIYIKHFLNDRYFIEFLDFLFNDINFDVNYMCNAIMETYENKMDNNTIKELNKLAKINYNKFINKKFDSIPEHLDFVNLNVSKIVPKLLLGTTVQVNKAIHVLIKHNTEIDVIYPENDYVCRKCDSDNCLNYVKEDRCDKLYKRCLSCPILYTCCHANAFIPYYKKSTCISAIRAELINYFFRFNKQYQSGILKI